MWTPGVVAALLLSAGVGLSLGLVGGGGSIITVPILVYVAGLPPRAAVALSLAIIGATAAVGAASHARAGRIHLRAAAVFGITGIAGAPLGALLTARVPSPVLLLRFAALMVAVGSRMLRGQADAEEPAAATCRPLKCGAAGLAVGFLTGFLGVGGGFLIVPTLLHFAKTPMRQAVSTSLLVIAVNSAAGFLAHLGDVGRYPGLAASFTAAALVGLVGGLVLARRVHPVGLKRIFGGVALTVAA
jgi:uncharacterized membrane protein YfcA